MSRGKHSEAQMIGALKQLEAGLTAADVAREPGVSKHTIFVWKAKFGRQTPRMHSPSGSLRFAGASYFK